MRYIELNPVRAGMAAQPRPYRWSSYAANALGEDNWVVSPHVEYLRLGHTPSQRREAYRVLFDVELAVEELDRIRNCSRSGAPIGNKRFKEHIEKTLNRKVGREKRGGPVNPSGVDRPA